MKKRITQDDYIKANRKASREAEIEMHGHPVCHKRVHESKKVYNRRKIKAADSKLPYLFYTTRVNSPVVESIINPCTFTSFGIKGWRTIKSTVPFTDFSVSSNPSSH